MADQDISQWSDARINRARFPLLKKTCDENRIAYPLKLVTYIAMNGDDPDKWPG